MKYLQFRGLKWAAVALFACAGMAQVRAQAQTSGASLPPIRIAMVESLSGPFANTGEAVFRNLVWATERVNARGGVSLPDVKRQLTVARYDSKGQNEEALSALRAAIDDGAQFILQGNSSATAAALLDATREDPAELRRRVTSPKGTTERAIAVLQGANLAGLFSEATDAAVARAAELAAGA